MRRAAAGVTLLLVLIAAGADTIRIPADIRSISSAAALRHSTELNNRPLIGILTETGSPAPPDHTWIAASYVRFVEAAGARAVPLQCDLPAKEMKRKFEKINGVLIPGGGQTLEPGHPYYDSVELLLSLTIEANDKGDYFPVHATCLGMQAVSLIIARDSSLLGAYDGDNNPSTVQLVPGGAHSRFWRWLPKRLRRAIQKQPITMENHSFGVPVTAFGENERLRSFFRVITTSADRQGKPFISTMEAKQYPIIATQWHPEKNSFEWTRKLDIPHSPEAVDVTLAVARHLGNMARRNFHRPADYKEENDMLIYNYASKFTGKYDNSVFEECYFLPKVPAQTNSIAVAIAAT